MSDNTKTKIPPTLESLEMDKAEMSKVCAKARKLAMTQSPFPFILADIGFNEPEMTYNRLLLGKAPELLNALKMGRMAGLSKLAEAQYKSALNGNIQALRATLLTRGRKTKETPDGFEDERSLSKLNVDAPIDNPDINVDQLTTKDEVIKVLAKVIVGEVKVSSSQFSALKAILQSFQSINFTPIDMNNVSFAQPKDIDNEKDSDKGLPN